MEEDLATSVKKEFEIVTHASEGEALRPPPQPPSSLFIFLSGTSSALPRTQPPSSLFIF